MTEPTNRQIDELLVAIGKDLKEEGVRADVDVIDEAEVARMLGGVSVSTVQRLARVGKLPSFKIGWLRMYRRTSILAYIEKAEATETARASKVARRAIGLEVIK